ncbi:MAG: LLM class F420-dependent oxidoreductase [Beutenbergiaceae bacterium]
MSFPVRIAVQLQPEHAPDYRLIRDAVLRSEDAGVDLVTNWDHFFPLNGDTEGAHYECWTMLGAWAEQTQRVEIGALVTGGGYRNPDLLADMARTVDHISGGRLVLGIGAGWNEKDYAEYRYPYGTPGSRLALLGEYLPRITSRLQRVNPAPVRPIPILIGGGGERKTLRLVAQYADRWHAFGDLDTLVRKAGVLVDHCVAAGTDAAAIEKSTRWPGAAVAGDYAAAGFTLFVVSTPGPDFDLGVVREAIAWRDAQQ